MKDAKQILIETLSERASSNPSYSLRAFARDLEISPQQLSNVMNGQRGLSLAAADKIMAKLDLTHHERNLFVESLKAKFSKSKTQRKLAEVKLKSIKAQSHAKNLELDLFKAISCWHHFALLELIKTSRKKQSTGYFAKKLNISEIEVQLSLKRLERLELISKKDNNWEVNQDIIIADQGIPTEAIKNFHRQIMEKATQALTFQTAKERYGSSSTLPIRVKNIEKAKKLIQEFRLAFDQEITDSEQGEEIYGLSIQFFRLTNKEGDFV